MPNILPWGKVGVSQIDDQNSFRAFYGREAVYVEMGQQKSKALDLMLYHQLNLLHDCTHLHPRANMAQAWALGADELGLYRAV